MYLYLKGVAKELIIGGAEPGTSLYENNVNVANLRYHKEIQRTSFSLSWLVWSAPNGFETLKRSDTQQRLRSMLVSFQKLTTQTLGWHWLLNKLITRRAHWGVHGYNPSRCGNVSRNLVGQNGYCVVNLVVDLPNFNPFKLMVFPGSIKGSISILSSQSVNPTSFIVNSSICWCTSLQIVPSGKLTVCYQKWPIVVDVPIKNCDFR